MVAAAAVGVALKGARRELDDRTAPLAGLVAAFIFATQMLNFPVASGTSGHLLGGALAAILVGPYTGLLCMATVFLVQCLLFADGGITALGTNIDLMGLVTVVGRLDGVQGPPGGAAQAALDGGAVGRDRGAGLGAGGGAGLRRSSTRSAAPPTSRSTTSPPRWSGVHVLIGIGEAAITALAVGSIVAVRPDLVYGARPVLEKRELVVRTAPDRGAAGMKRTSTKVVAAGILLVALVLAGVVSRFASSDPDGLTKVSEDNGFADTGEGRTTAWWAATAASTGSPRRPRRAGSGRRASPTLVRRRGTATRPPTRPRRDRVE